MTPDFKKNFNNNFVYVFFFNLTVAKELTPNPGEMYNQDKDIVRYGKVPKQEALNGKVNILYRYASNLQPIITTTEKTKGK